MINPTSRPTSRSVSLFCILKGILIISALVTIAAISYVKIPFHQYHQYLNPKLEEEESKPDIAEMFPYTDFHKSWGASNEEFFLSHKPSFVCPSSLLTRVGRKGDGGKWTCGLENLGKHTMNNGRNCTVYSFGVAGDSSFEAEVLQTTSCNIFAYDLSVNGIGSPLKNGNPRLHFHKMGISGNNTKTTKTLKTLMTENGHSFADILKIDVEGWEYDTFDRMFQDFNQTLPFGQLLVEVHVSLWTLENKKRLINLLMELEEKGARMFYVEPNAVSRKCCSEYSFINLHYLNVFTSS